MASFGDNETIGTSPGTGVIELADRTQFTIIAVFFCIISIVGVAGNTLVIVAVALCRKLQTATNVFVVSLAVTDFLSCVMLPFQAASFLARDGWALPDGLCAFVGAISIICLVGSIVTLALIAFNRCYLITQPRKNYTWLYTTKKLVIMTSMAWLFPTLVLVAPQAAGIGKLGYAPSYKACLWDETHHLAYINDILVAVTFFFTFVIILVCYIKIWIYIRGHVRKLRLHSSMKERSNLDELSTTQDNVTDTQPSIVNSNNVTSPNKKNGTIDRRRRNKASISTRDIEITKNLFYIICAFFLCIMPYAITLTLPVDPTLDVLVLYASVPLMCNGCVNPFIYAYKHPTMKVVFRYILRCEIASIPKPSKCLRRMLDSRSRMRGRRQVTTFNSKVPHHSASEVQKERSDSNL